MTLTLGQRLREARETRGLSLLDAAHETRIPALRLQHLEEDNLASFGSLTYARSFLKLYSDFLAVDAAPTLDDLPSAVFAGPQDYRYLTESFGPWVRERPRIRERLPAETSPQRVQTIKSPLPAAIAVFICVLVATGIFGKYIADSQRTLAEQQTFEQQTQEPPSATAQPMQTASSTPATEQVQAAVPVDPITLAPRRSYPVLQPGEGL
jgi:cytoskeletal protein RodZ